MILLGSSTSWKLQLVTGSAGSIQPALDYVDNAGGSIAAAPSNVAAIATATTTDLVTGAASTIRNVKFLSVRNGHASVSNLVTIQRTDGTITTALWQGTLLPSESVNYNEGCGWQYLDANGNPKLAAAKLDQVLRTTADVINATTSFADVSGLTAPVKAGKHYWIEVGLFHITNATTTGAQFGVGGVAMTGMQIGAISTVLNSATAATMSTGQATAIDTAVIVQTTGAAAVGPTIMSGWINPSADGTFAVRCASEVAVAAGLTVKKGSWLKIREFDN